MSKAFAKVISSTPGELALLIGVGAVAFYIINHVLSQDLKDAAGAVGDAVSGASEIVGGIATGKNVVTADTPYEGTGVFGTLGAATDAVGGGFFSSIGSWLGDTVYDYTHSEESNTLQGSTGNPYSPTGPSSQYREAANNSPVNARDAANPFAYSEWYP